MSLEKILQDHAQSVKDKDFELRKVLEDRIKNEVISIVKDQIPNLTWNFIEEEESFVINSDVNILPLKDALNILSNSIPVLPFPYDDDNDFFCDLDLSSGHIKIYGSNHMDLIRFGNLDKRLVDKYGGSNEKRISVIEISKLLVENLYRRHQEEVDDANNWLSGQNPEKLKEYIETYKNHIVFWEEFPGNNNQEIIDSLTNLIELCEKRIRWLSSHG